MNPAIAAEALFFRYAASAERWVLEDVTVRATGGCVTGIIGPNAAGKTTLLRLLLGAMRPQRGRVRLGGEDLDHLSAVARAQRMAYVSQRPTVDAGFRVAEVIALGRFATGHSRSAVRAAIDRCALGDIADTPYHLLSVGQQQRVSLARALCQLDGGRSGQALLLDEPVSAMDPQHLVETAAILREVAEAGVAVIIVLHDLPLVARLCDAVWALQAGRLRASGPTGETLSLSLLERLYGTRFDLMMRQPDAASGGGGEPSTGQEPAVPLPTLRLRTAERLGSASGRDAMQTTTPP